MVPARVEVLQSDVYDSAEIWFKSKIPTCTQIARTIRLFVADKRANASSTLRDLCRCTVRTYYITLCNALMCLLQRRN